MQTLIQLKFESLFKDIDKPVVWEKFNINISICDKGRVQKFKSFFVTNNETISDLKPKYNWFNISDFLKNLYNESILSANKWNRINFTKSKRGQSSVEIFWDETYFIEMHNVSYEVYYQEELGKL